MRSIFLLGGFVGFTLVLVSGVLAGRDVNLILRDAAIGCLVMALTFRWFWAVVIRTFRETVRHKRILAEKSAAEALREVDAAKPPAGHQRLAGTTGGASPIRTTTPAGASR